MVVSERQGFCSGLVLLQLFNAVGVTSSLRFCSRLSSLITVARPASAASLAPLLSPWRRAPSVPDVVRLASVTEPSTTVSTTSMAMASIEPCSPLRRRLRLVFGQSRFSSSFGLAMEEGVGRWMLAEPRKHLRSAI